MPDKTTHFGYKTVNVEEKAGKVAEVFHSVADKYDLMNDYPTSNLHIQEFTIVILYIP